MKTRLLFCCFIFFSMALLLTGCSNPFTKHYTSLYKLPPSAYNPNPKIIKVEGSEFENKAYEIAENGYMPIGKSSFTADNRYIKNSRYYVFRQSTNVFADVAVFSVNYIGTEDQSYTYEQPVTHTAYTTYDDRGSGYINTYDGPAYATYSGGGSAITTFETTETRYVKKLVDIYNYAALYFKHYDGWGIGISYSDLNSSDHKAIGTNKGIYVNLVIKNSPAFYADVVRGDVIVELDGAAVYNANSFASMIEKHVKPEIHLTIWRNGSYIQKTIKKNQ